MRAPDELVTVRSPVDFAMTLDRITAAIEAGGLTIFARIDHAAGAASVGLAMPPTLVVIYGSPRGGTPIMEAAPDTALDLPLRVVVRERADGAAEILYHAIEPALRRASTPGNLASRLNGAQFLLGKALQA